MAVILLTRKRPNKLPDPVSSTFPNVVICHLSLEIASSSDVLRQERITL